jgi:arylsulfatase A-like enzyme
MRRREFIKAVGTGIVSFTMPGIALAAAAPSKRPNIIYILLDELGYFELSCMGNKYLMTPNIDRMAAEGMRFTQALAGAPVCAPSRSVLMTGQHTGHTTVRTNPGGVPLREDDVTIAQVLKQAGYATGGFGKWGCGDRETTGVPEEHGFDVFFGYYHQVHAHSYYPCYLIRSGEKVPLQGNTGVFYTGKQYSHHLIFSETIRFIRQNRDRPFFCYACWTPPHGVWAIPEDEPAWQEFKDKPWTAGDRTPNDAKVYAAMVKMVDRQIGEILALLKELGIDDNTIVFVSGDNGGPGYFANGDPTKPKPEEPPYPHGFFGANLNPHTGQRFRGGKGNLYEGGLRIPMVVRWPGKIKAGAVSDHLWYFPDVMPTLADLAGIKPPENTDGISIVPTLLGGDAAGRRQRRHEYLYWEYGAQTAVRMGKWKAVKPGKNRPFELYDLSGDIEEKTDVASEQAEILSKMKGYAEQAHAENIPGGWIDQEKGFKGHQLP